MKKLTGMSARVNDFWTRHGLLYWLWLILSLTGLGCCIGVLSLVLSAYADLSLVGKDIFLSYLDQPLLLFLNLWPAVALVWLFYFLTRRGWAGFLGGALPVVGLALVNYFKIRLRADPLLFVDLGLATEAAGIMGRYQLDLTPVVMLILVCLALGLAGAALLVPRARLRWPERLLGVLSALSLLAVSFVSLYVNPQIYQQVGAEELVNVWNQTECYVIRGGIYPFLYSSRDLMESRPADYDEQMADEQLEQYTDADIPAERKVSVMGIMLEAFCDLTDFPALAEQEGVAQVYAPWHELEEQSVSGRLLTNIFAGGTVDSEWAFLTGYSTHDEFRRDTDSYVWYLRNQGYQTFGSHPGFGWFYNRQNVDRYLGFEEYWFTENHYGDLVDPVAAQWSSDRILVRELLAQLQERIADGPCFSFSVSYQNHGPYEWTYTAGEPYLTPEGSGLEEETCHVFNNYLKGVADTIDVLTGLTQELEELDEPVVLVLFGDHKPWGGNGNSAYTDLGATFDLSTLQGFYDYYATPYVIWANSAAKAALGQDFVGDGGDFSPCFLMTELFDLCGWEGPGFMQMSRQLRDITPLVHEQGLYLVDGALTDTLPEEDQALVNTFLNAQYRREHSGIPY